MFDRRRRRRFPAAVLSAVLTLSVGAVACSAATPDRAELTDALATSGLPRDVAQCAADALVSELSEQELDLLVERGNGGVPPDDPDRDDDAADRLRAALADCRKLLPTSTLAPTEPTEPTEPTVEPEPTSPSTSTPVTRPTTGDGSRLEPAPSSSSVP